MAFYELLNPILNPLLQLGVFNAILLISLIVSLITTLVYKFVTDQKKLKELKDKTKEYQNKLKTIKDNPQKSLEVQQEMMSVNLEYMKASFKPMFITIIPLLLFFGWLGATLAYVPLDTGVPFDVTVILNKDISGEIELNLPEQLSTKDNLTKTYDGELNWTIVAKEYGTYDLKFTHKETGEERIVSIIVTNDQKYISPIHQIDSKIFKIIAVQHQKLIVFKDIYLLNKIPWIKNFGWLGAYILFSIIFSTTLRKIMKIS